MAWLIHSARHEFLHIADATLFRSHTIKDMLPANARLYKKRKFLKNRKPSTDTKSSSAWTYLSQSVSNGSCLLCRSANGSRCSKPINLLRLNSASKKTPPTFNASGFKKS